MDDSTARPSVMEIDAYTKRKYDLIEKQIEQWALRQLEGESSRGIIYIDCFSGSGLAAYGGKLLYSAPLRAAKKLFDAALSFPSKEVYLYFCDAEEKNIAALKGKLAELLPQSAANFHVYYHTADGNFLLKRMGEQLSSEKRLGYFLYYAPSPLAFDWEALAPFIRTWGDVLIDPVYPGTVKPLPEALQQEKDGMCLSRFARLAPHGKTREAYDERLAQVLAEPQEPQPVQVAAFPVFDAEKKLSREVLCCTGDFALFRSFKAAAWQSLSRKTKPISKQSSAVQLMLDLDSSDGGIVARQEQEAPEESCFTSSDIARYLACLLQGTKVPRAQVWSRLEVHPVFPSDGFRNPVRRELKSRYGVTEETLELEGGLKETYYVFPGIREETE